MAHYQGQTLQEMIDYIVAVAQAKGWKINETAMTRFINEANAELELDSEWLASLFTVTTVADSNVYTMPEDMHILHGVMMKKTTDDGYFPLKAVSYKEIQASLADDSADDVIEP